MTDRHKKEKREWVVQGMLDHSLGKSRSSYPHSMLSTTYWLKGWDEAEQQRLNDIHEAKMFEKDSLLESIDDFERSGDHVALSVILRIIVEKLEF